MSRSFLWMGPAGLSVLVAACGGTVVIDLPGGTGGAGHGGHGGSTATSTFSTTTGVDVTVGTDVATSVTVGPGPTTGVGPMMCDCQQACAVLAACGIQLSQCTTLCNQEPPQLLACVCANASTCNVKQCLGTVGTGPGPGAAVSSSSGGGVACSACANGPGAAGMCAMQSAACTNDPTCPTILACHQMCGWTPQCKQQCDGTGFNGPFHALISCKVCASCNLQCQGTQVFDEYCVLPP